MGYVDWVVLTVNVVWFGLGFRLFALKPRKAVRLLVTPASNEESSRKALVDSLPFLGGLNLGFVALSGGQIFASVRYGSAASWTVFFASAVAHATQFAGNLPNALRGGRSGGASWDVLRGPMLVIFVGDATCALAKVVALAL